MAIQETKKKKKKKGSYQRTETLCYAHPSLKRTYDECTITATTTTRITWMKAHPGDNFLTFENIITGGAFIGVCGI